VTCQAIKSVDFIEFFEGRHIGRPQNSL